MPLKPFIQPAREADLPRLADAFKSVQTMVQASETPHNPKTFAAWVERLSHAGVIVGDKERYYNHLKPAIAALTRHAVLNGLAREPGFPNVFEKTEEEPGVRVRQGVSSADLNKVRARIDAWVGETAKVRLRKDARRVFDDGVRNAAFALMSIIDLEQMKRERP